MATDSRKPKLWKEFVNFTQDDLILMSLIEEHGVKKWSTISKLFTIKANNTRTAKQCRDRWHNNLCSLDTSKTAIRPNAHQIFDTYKLYPNQWSKIAKNFPSFSENQIKNLFYSTVRRNIRKFNKGKLECEKIFYTNLGILYNDELREILLAPKEVKKEVYLYKFLTQEALQFMKTRTFERVERKETVIDSETQNEEHENLILHYDESSNKEENTLEDIILEEQVSQVFPEYEFELEYQFH